MNTNNIYENGNIVIVKYNNKNFTAEVLDSAGNGDYKLDPIPAIKGKFWFKQEAILRLATALEIERFTASKNERDAESAKKQQKQQEKKNMSTSKPVLTAKDVEDSATTEGMEVKSKGKEKVMVTTELIPFSMPASRTFVNVRLHEIVDLKNTSIRNAAMAKRGISKSHLIHLINAQDTDIPPVSCTHSNQGWILLDGYHRYNRAIALGIVEFYRIQTGVNLFIDQETGGACEVSQEVLDRVKKELQPHQDALDAFIAELTIPVKPENFSNEIDLVDFAFKANLHHGLTASDTSRVRYGWWLYLEKGKSYREAALIVGGISHIAIYNYGRRNARVEEAMQDETVSPERVEEQKQIIEQDKTEKPRNALATSMRNIWPTLSDTDPDNAVLWLKDSFKATDAEMVAGFATLLLQLAASLSKEAGK